MVSSWGKNTENGSANEMNHPRSAPVAVSSYFLLPGQDRPPILTEHAHVHSTQHWKFAVWIPYFLHTEEKRKPHNE